MQARRLRYHIAALLSRRAFAMNWLNFRDVVHRKPLYAMLRLGKPVCPSEVFKNKLRQDNTPEAYKSGFLM